MLDTPAPPAAARDPLPDRAITAAVGLLAALADRPRVLLAACFALNALFLPYPGLYHDARLYAAQVVQAGTGELAGDLFFKYGSQSRYTLFPELLAVPARVVGVEATFFAAYLLFNTLRLVAFQLLAFRVLGRTPAVAGGLLLAAVAPVWFGSSNAFAANEWFFTARVPAVALSALALERLLAGKRLTAAGLLAAGIVVHPLMTAPAVGVAVAFTAWEWATTRPRKWLVAAGVLLGMLAVAAYLMKTAGSLDPEWKELTLRISPHLDPRNWHPPDVPRLGLAVLAALAAAKVADPRTRVWWGAVLAVAFAGLVAGQAAAVGTWALPFQAQPLRALWPLEALRYPAGLALVARLWAGGPPGRLAAVALFTALVPGYDLFYPGAPLAFGTAAVVGLLLAKLTARPNDENWLWRGLAVGIGLWAVAWYGILTPVKVADLYATGNLASMSFGDQLEHSLWPFGACARFAAALGILAVVVRLIPSDRAKAVTLAAAGLLLAGLAFEVPRLDAVRERESPPARDVRFVADWLRGHPAGRRGTVYWPRAPLETVWFELHADCYFQRSLLAGNVFSKQTAVVGQERVKRVAHAEVYAIQRQFGAHPELGGEVLNEPLPPPDRAWLDRLAEDPAVDVVVLPYDLGGAADSNGSVWVYDLRAGR